MNIIVVDNYDSFTYNLVQTIQSFGAKVTIIKNDDKLHFTKLSSDKIVISPGPGTPKDAGNSNQIIEQLKGEIPILGVCLGHQCIGAVFNVDVQQSNRILHGKTSLIHHEHSDLFKDIPSPFQAARYHSLSLKSIPKGFKKTAWTNDGEIMGIQHDSLPLFGVQFHPESFLTPMGSKILENFLHGE